MEFLNSLGLKEVRYRGQSALLIPYLDEQGGEGPVRFRLRLEKSEKCRWAIQMAERLEADTVRALAT